MSAGKAIRYGLSIDKETLEAILGLTGNSLSSSWSVEQNERDTQMTTRVACAGSTLTKSEDKERLLAV